MTVCILCGDEIATQERLPLCGRCAEKVRNMNIDRWECVDENHLCAACGERPVWIPATKRGYQYCLSCATERWCDRCGATLSDLVFVWEGSAVCEECQRRERIVAWKEQVSEKLDECAESCGFTLVDCHQAETGTEYRTYCCTQCGVELKIRISDHMSAYGTEDVSIDYGSLGGTLADAVKLFKSHECDEEEEET